MPVDQAGNGQKPGAVDVFDILTIRWKFRRDSDFDDLAAVNQDVDFGTQPGRPVLRNGSYFA